MTDCKSTNYETLTEFLEAHEQGLPNSRFYDFLERHSLLHHFFPYSYNYYEELSDEEEMEMRCLTPEHRITFQRLQAFMKRKAEEEVENSEILDREWQQEQSPSNPFMRMSMQCPW